VTSSQRNPAEAITKVISATLLGRIATGTE
jgi:hypothetical protein